MFRIFNRYSSPQFRLGGQPVVIETKQLKQDECLVIKYDQNGNPVTIEKVGTYTALGCTSFGKAESDISPGQRGRVFYNGCSWQAYCDGDLPIRKGQTVLIIARQALHLFVAPLEHTSESSL
ncbi:MAG: NfeD family protein [Cyanobacteria bacterium J06649_11]